MSARRRMMTNGFDGRAAIVTGGSRGIGRAMAAALLSRGANVTICGLDEQTLARAAEELTPLAVRGAAVQPVTADVREPVQVGWLVDATEQRFGGLDFLINNAGIGRFGPVAEMSFDDWTAMVETNLSGVFHCCRAAVPALQRRGGGWIVNVSSLAGSHPFAGAAGYCATKAAVDAFTEALMQEVRQNGIRVASVVPGSVDTGFGGSGPADWKLRPEDVAQVVVDLIAHSPRALPSRVEIRPSKPSKR